MRHQGNEGCFHDAYMRQYVKLSKDGVECKLWNYYILKNIYVK